MASKAMSWADQMDAEDSRAPPLAPKPAPGPSAGVYRAPDAHSRRLASPPVRFDTAGGDSSPPGTDELSSSGVDFSSDAAPYAVGVRTGRGRRGGNKRRAHAEQARAERAAAAAVSAGRPSSVAAAGVATYNRSSAQPQQPPGALPAVAPAPAPAGAASHPPPPRPQRPPGAARSSGSESGGRGGLVSAPWAPKPGSRNVPLQPLKLGEEMADFAAYVSLTPEEQKQRQDCVDAVSAAAAAAWTAPNVLPYGSFALGLSLPLSDLDVAVDSCGLRVCDGVDVFCVWLVEHGWEVLGCASSEADAFVKARSSAVGVLCNISFTAGRSPVREGLDLLRGLLQVYPQVRPVVVVLRTVLSQCQLTDVGAGGLSSYCVLLLTIRVAQFRGPHSGADCGTVLRDVLKHYGTDFDFTTQTAALALGAELPAERLHAGDAVSVADPLDGRNNIAQGCTKLKQARAMLKYCDLALALWDAPSSQQQQQEGEEVYRGRTPLSTIIAARAVAGRRPRH